MRIDNQHLVGVRQKGPELSDALPSELGVPLGDATPVEEDLRAGDSRKVADVVDEEQHHPVHQHTRGGAQPFMGLDVAALQRHRGQYFEAGEQKHHKADHAGGG
mmetsp:Transcript_126010/g.247024  ORF Transcript_126010/g.247024 Transcript_126010/m.247024 type:complete len:104 (-) Transcript_126010:184-495(-)